MTANPTACLLIIGNEVLSGRTQDANLQFLATRLGELGIPLREVRVIPDVAARRSSETVNEVRTRFDHVFTTGGIGPTHDDITSECVAGRLRRAVGGARRGRGADGGALREIAAPSSTPRAGAWPPCRAARR